MMIECPCIPTTICHPGPMRLRSGRIASRDDGFVAYILVPEGLANP